ncbi:MAG: L-threonylcarbamoyladenylate synthase, partial [Methylobacter sp.]|nr:L-threonylcarbamoyladenylate synthase [Methylobacter sp.]
MQEPSSSLIDSAADVLRNGGLVAFPTETVYGLGANACDPAAVRRIFEAKGRPADHPLIIHLHSLENLDFWANDITESVWRLAEHFWPGPLTLILKRRHAPLTVTGGQETVGLRIPNHPVALALLKAFNGGLAAPSANRFGKVSPTRAKHVRAELGDRVDLILEGGPCRMGVESTILSLVDGQPRLLRPGSISLSALQEVLGTEILTPTPASNIRAPGMLKSHYSPETRFELCPKDQLNRRGNELASSGLRTAVMFIGSAQKEQPEPKAFTPL